MHLVTFKQDGQWRVGALVGSAVAPLDVAASSVHSPMRALLTAGADALNLAHDEAERRFASGDGVVQLSDLILGPPVPDPDKILCLGFNYKAHVTEMLTDAPVSPNIFAKFRNGLIGSGDRIILPRASTEIDYEGELAAIIGRRCRNVTVSEALDFVAGYTALNDVTARDLQFQTSQWTLGKAIDTFCPMGPVVVLSEEVPDPQALELTTRLNGEIVQQTSCAAMVFSVAETVAAISSVITLEPGDVISTGTPEGVGWKHDPPRFLLAGDVIEVEISGIGTLRNEVVEGEPVGHDVVASEFDDRLPPEREHDSVS
jgi:2-keto-4-pentenoate hydratase/2-oxohepta-3-ene-1,7-dioic acid hydratase in catechol pathway